MDKLLCPLLNKPCIEDKCRFWVHVLGNHPQTGEVLNKFDCSFAWFPVLLIENSKLQRETGAAVESMRNEINAGAGTILARIAGLKLPREVP
jgi:hypothetical protein